MKQFIFFVILSIFVSSITVTPFQVRKRVYLAAIRHELIGIEYHDCIGSILSSNIILTSARCVEYLPTPDIRVIYGYKQHKRTAEVKLVIKHPYFKIRTYENNIALLVTKKKIKFIPDIVEPIQIEINEHIGFYMACGWGLVNVNF